MDCLFCKIANSEIPCKKIYEDDKILAFYDIEPQSPVHFLVIPKQHIASANDVTDKQSDVVGHIFSTIATIAHELGISQDGYRIVNNCGKNAMQSVQHLHFHVLAGRQLSWPPG